jgi:glycerol-3-phosphate cytidylyltransferase
LILELIDYVDQVISEYHWDQKIEDVLKHKIDIFVMGDDWEGEFDILKEYCQVMYLPRTKGISTIMIKKIYLLLLMCRRRLFNRYFISFFAKRRGIHYIIM